MCHYNIRKYSFCARVVNMWNSLPNDVVEADTVNTFKNRLHKHWYNQDVLFDFNADLIGTGSIPICMWSNVCKMRAKRTTCARLNAMDWIGLDWSYSQTREGRFLRHRFSWWARSPLTVDYGTVRSPRRDMQRKKIISCARDVVVRTR